MKYKLIRTILPLLLLAVVVMVFMSIIESGKNDPLPSWKDGQTKSAIIEFVNNSIKEGSKGYIKPADRIAVFDNDGTLWQEKPTVEGVFLLKTVKQMIAADPSLRNKEPFKSVVEKDTAYFEKGGYKAVVELVTAAYGNKSEKEFEEEISTFLRTAKHPKYNVLYTRLAYQPMLELLSYLRSKGFETWICSGGSSEFVRAFSDHVYGIPVQQVIGSTLKLKFKKKEDRFVLWKDTVIESISDKEQKPVNISYHIGKVPVFAVGNERTGGDIAMLTYSGERKGPSFQMIINHDDAAREFSYEEKDSASLKAAHKNDWQVVSMKNDWNSIFSK